MVDCALEKNPNATITKVDKSNLVFMLNLF
jgi:hypothetical protein